MPETFKRYFLFLFKNTELFFWITGLIILALSNPAHQHFTICPLANAGFTFCPGCGLGHSISWLFRLNFTESFHSHFFGLPALLIILFRIKQLLFNQFKKRDHESKTINAYPGN